MSSQYIAAFLGSELFTITVETVILSIFLLFVFRNKHYSSYDLLSAGFFASGMTIPYVWFVFPYLFDWSRSVSLLISEPAITMIEAIFYTLYLKLPFKKSLFISIVCNVASFFLGRILREYNLWIF